MFRRLPFLIAIFLVPFATQRISAQQGGAPKNLITGGDFERSVPRDNLWDGVDGDGYLAGSRLTVPALSETGIRGVAMPVSVKLADMNGDRLLDLVMGDPLGYIWVYFNSGSPTDPKFTTAELLPIFLWQPVAYADSPRDESDQRTYMRRVPKVEMADFTGKGTLDLIIGLYSGEVAVIPNTGSASAPVFKQPAKVDSAMLSTSQAGHLWGNLFSPVVMDWDGDRRTDLLLGEGSYSANSVHLLLNSGSGTAPKFTDEQRYYLAYGNGREHLHPSVADLNGDGKMDILTSDREGNISLYLNKSASWKPGDQLDFTSVVSLGGSSSQKNLISLTSGDYNGDGKIDILFGKTNGRIAVSLNTGTPQEPKFSAPTEIKGTDVHKRNLRLPSGWDISTGTNSGNAFAVVTAVDAATDPDAAPPQGKFALKFYYAKPLNKVITPGIVEFPGIGDKFRTRLRTTFTASDYEFYSDTRTITMVRSLSGLKVGKAYQFSFKHKGGGVKDANYEVAYRGYKKLAPEKVTQKAGRGVQIEKFERAEDLIEAGTFSPGSSWSEASKSFTVNFKDRDLKTLPSPTSVKLVVTFELSGFDSVLYLDDFQLVEK